MPLSEAVRLLQAKESRSSRDVLYWSADEDLLCMHTVR